MASFLLMWNPKKSPTSELLDVVDKVRTGGYYKCSWTCWNKKAKSGDRFFLMRLGVAPKGIIGFGCIRSEPHLKSHFEGKESPQVDIRFDCLSEYPIISENELKSNFKMFTWFYQKGALMPDEISNKLQDFLDKRRVSHSNKKNTSRIISEDEASRYPEGKPKYKVHRELERDTSIAIKAKMQRLDSVGELKCDVCTFSFLERYGKLGGSFIEAHHTIPVSKLKGARKTSIKEIALVCSNCHRMLHTGERWLSVEELRKLIRKPMA